MAARFALPLLLVLAGGCIAPRPASAPAAGASASELRPEVFFLGRTRGEARLVVRSRPLDEVVRVESTGRAEADGTFRLDQTIHRSARTTQRSWRMRRTGPSTYAATLTEAAGLATATVEGPTLTIRYPMNRWGMRMEQTLTLLPGDTEVQNEATVSWMGLPMAYLSERIVRL